MSEMKIMGVVEKAKGGHRKAVLKMRKGMRNQFMAHAR